MITTTRTYTMTDIRIAFEMFAADLNMLALRTQAMEPKRATECAADVCLMAQEDCLTTVHIQLLDASDKLVRAHRYSVDQGIWSDSQRPGENKWPRLPDGLLTVIVNPSDTTKLDRLKTSGRLRLQWTNSRLSTDYSRMRNDGSRLYSSNTYGLRRSSFIN